MMNTSKIAIPTYFDCKTIEDAAAFPKVSITAELIIDCGAIHHEKKKAEVPCEK